MQRMAAKTAVMNSEYLMAASSRPHAENVSPCFLFPGLGAKDRGEPAITQDLIRGPPYNGSLVVSATENTHAATAPTCDFCFGYGRARSLRLHLHAETVKKITHEKPEGSSFRRTSARLFRPRRRKGRSLGGPQRTGH